MAAVGVGSVSHCAHGSDITLQRIVDWRPFTGFTIEANPEGVPITTTISTDLEPTEGGTRLTVRLGADPTEHWPALSQRLLPGLRETYENLQRLTAGL